MSNMIPRQFEKTRQQGEINISNGVFRFTFLTLLVFFGLLMLISLNTIIFFVKVLLNNNDEICE